MKTVSKIKSALIYVQALYGSAQNATDLDILYQDARQLKSLSTSDFDELNKLNRSLLSVENKITAIDAVAEKMQLSSSMRNTLRILVQNRKLDLLKIITQQFIELYQKKHNIAEVEVMTAVPLSEKQDIKLKETLSSVFNKKVEINYINAPSIIGGLVIKYGTNFIDNSIRHKLNMLEQIMKGIK